MNTPCVTILHNSGLVTKHSRQKKPRVEFMYNIVLELQEIQKALYTSCISRCRRTLHLESMRLTYQFYHNFLSNIAAACHRILREPLETILKFPKQNKTLGCRCSSGVEQLLLVEMKRDAD